MRKKTKKRCYFFLTIAGLLILLAIFAPYFCPNDPYKTNPAAMKVAPCLEYPFGTDKLGRCVFSRVLMGARTSIFCSMILVAVDFLIGTILGLLCGYYEGIFDTLIMRFADILLAFPQMVLAIAVAGILGGSMLNAMIAMGFAGWTLYARLARSQVLAIKQEEFVKAARMGGCSDARILVFHLLPNVLGTLIVNANQRYRFYDDWFCGPVVSGTWSSGSAGGMGSMINESRAYLQIAMGRRFFRISHCDHRHGI